MAAVTLLGTATFNTSTGTKTVTATPAVGDLIVIIVAHTGNTTIANPTDNNSSGTYTSVGTVLKNASADQMEVYIRNDLIASATSTIFTHAPGTTSGGGLLVFKVTGMTKIGPAALRQMAKQANQASGGTPTPVFNKAVLTGNPVIAAVFNATSPATMTPRSSPAYTERADLGYSTPTTGIEAMSIDSGETVSSIAWGNTSASAFCSIAIELDVSAVTVRFSENFDGGSVNLTTKTPNIGSAWSAVWTDTGTDQFITNGSGDGAAAGAAGGGFIYTANINAAGAANSSADGYQQLIIQVNPDSTHPMYFVTRYADTSNFYLIGFFGTFIRMYKCVGTTMTQVGADFPYTSAVGDIVGLTNYGSYFYIYVNNAILTYYTDSSLTSAGRNGIAAGDVTNRIDNSFSAGVWRVNNYWATYNFPQLFPDTTTLNTPADAATGQVTTPTLNFTGTDPNSDTLEYNVQLHTDNIFNDITLDGTNTESSVTSASSLTFSRDTASGSNKGLIVQVSCFGLNRATSGITYAGVAMTLLKQTDANNTNISIWFLPNPATGTNNVVVTQPGTCDGIAAGAVALFNVQQSTTPNANFGAALSATSGVTSSLTTTSDRCWIFDAIGDQSAVLSPTIDQTSSLNKFSSTARASYRVNVPTGSNSMSWSWSGSETGTFNGIALAPASTPLLNKVSSSDSGFTAGHPFTSGSAKDFTVQAGDTLSGGTTYYWRVRAIDPSGANTYGAFSSVRSFTAAAPTVSMKVYMLNQAIKRGSIF